MSFIKLLLIVRLLNPSLIDFKKDPGNTSRKGWKVLLVFNSSKLFSTIPNDGFTPAWSISLSSLVITKSFTMDEGSVLNLVVWLTSSSVQLSSHTHLSFTNTLWFWSLPASLNNIAKIIRSYDRMTHGRGGNISDARMPVIRTVNRIFSKSKTIASNDLVDTKTVIWPYPLGIASAWDLRFFLTHLQMNQNVSRLAPGYPEWAKVVINLVFSSPIITFQRPCERRIPLRYHLIVSPNTILLLCQTLAQFLLTWEANKPTLLHSLVV